MKHLMALTTYQPWVHAIFHCGKDVENRDWPTKFRGTLAIHAAKKEPRDEYVFVQQRIADDIKGYGKSPFGELPSSESLPRGAIVGLVEVVDCVTHWNGDNPPSGSTLDPKCSSYWFVGDYGFVLRSPRLLPTPIPCRGYQGFWKVSDDIRAQIDEVATCSQS